MRALPLVLAPSVVPFASLPRLPFARCVLASLCLAVGAGAANAATLPRVDQMQPLTRSVFERWNDTQGTAIQRADAKALMAHATSSLTANVLEDRVFVSYIDSPKEETEHGGSVSTFFHPNTLGVQWVSDLSATLLGSVGAPRGWVCMVSLLPEREPAEAAGDGSFDADESPELSVDGVKGHLARGRSYLAAMERYRKFRKVENAMATEMGVFNDHDTLQALNWTAQEEELAFDNDELFELVGRSDADDATVTVTSLRIVLRAMEADALGVAYRYRDTLESTREFESALKSRIEACARARSSMEPYRAESMAEGVR